MNGWPWWWVPVAFGVAALLVALGVAVVQRRRRPVPRDTPWASALAAQRRDVPLQHADDAAVEEAMVRRLRLPEPVRTEQARLDGPTEPGVPARVPISDIPHLGSGRPRRERLPGEAFRPGTAGGLLPPSD